MDMIPNLTIGNNKMNSMEWKFTQQEWVIATVVIFATLGLASVTRAILKWAGKNKNWEFLSALAPAISNLIYILGLRILIDIVPLNPKFLAWMDSGAYLVAVMILLWLARRTILVAIDWGVSHSNTSTVLYQGFIPLMRNVVTLFVFLSGGIMVLKRFNYDVMSLITALGVSSLAVGLAAKETLSNMISGFTLIIDRNLKPGDRVNLGGNTGEVDEIGLRSTRIKTGDGNMLIVPNSELVNTKIINLSSPFPQVCCTTSIRVPCLISFEKIQTTCLKMIEQIEKIDRSQGIWIHLTSLSEGHQLITIGFWVRQSSDQGATLSEFNQKLIQYLNQEKIPLLGPTGSGVTS